jgi:hypothetical protein
MVVDKELKDVRGEYQKPQFEVVRLEQAVQAQISGANYDAACGRGTSAKPGYCP